MIDSRLYTAVRITEGNRAASGASGKAGHGMSGSAEIDHGAASLGRHTLRLVYIVCPGIVALQGDLQAAEALTMRDVPPDVLTKIIRHCCGDNVHALDALTHVNRTFKDAVMQVRMRSREASRLPDVGKQMIARPIDLLCRYWVCWKLLKCITYMREEFLHPRQVKNCSVL